MLQGGSHVVGAIPDFLHERRLRAVARQRSHALSAVGGGRLRRRDRGEPREQQQRVHLDGVRGEGSSVNDVRSELTQRPNSIRASTFQ